MKVALEGDGRQGSRENGWGSWPSAPAAAVGVSETRSGFTKPAQSWAPRGQRAPQQCPGGEAVTRPEGWAGDAAPQVLLGGEGELASAVPPARGCGTMACVLEAKVAATNPAPGGKREAWGPARVESRPGTGLPAPSAWLPGGGGPWAKVSLPPLRPPPPGSGGRRPCREQNTAAWLGKAGYFKQHLGELCVTLETGQMPGWAAAAHLCSARGCTGGSRTSPLRGSVWLRLPLPYPVRHPLTQETLGALASPRQARTAGERAGGATAGRSSHLLCPGHILLMAWPQTLPLSSRSWLRPPAFLWSPGRPSSSLNGSLLPSRPPDTWPGWTQAWPRSETCG